MCEATRVTGPDERSRQMWSAPPTVLDGDQPVAPPPAPSAALTDPTEAVPVVTPPPAAAPPPPQSGRHSQDHAGPAATQPIGYAGPAPAPLASPIGRSATPGAATQPPPAVAAPVVPPQPGRHSQDHTGPAA